MKIPITPPFKDVDYVAHTQTCVEAIDSIFDKLEENNFSWRRRGGLWAWWLTGEPGTIDGIFWWENKKKLIVVSNGDIYVFPDPYTAPTIVNPPGVKLKINVPVCFETNGNWLFMANETPLIAWDGSNQAQYVPGAPECSSVVFLNNTLVVNQLGTNLVRFTAPQEYTVTTLPIFTPYSFGPEASPDNLIKIHSAFGELFLCGTRTIEFWYYSGDSEEAPFQRQSGAYLERGLISSSAILNFKNTIFFIDHDRNACAMEGRTPKIISQPFDQTIRNMTSFENASMFSVDNRFICITLPKSDYCLVYDTYHGGWGKWCFWDTDTGKYQRFLGICSCYVPEWNTQFIGGRKDGRVYIYSQNLVTDAFNPIRALLLTAPIDAGTMKYKIAHKLFLRLKRGI